MESVVNAIASRPLMAGQQLKATVLLIKSATNKEIKTRKSAAYVNPLPPKQIGPLCLNFAELMVNVTKMDRRIVQDVDHAIPHNPQHVGQSKITTAELMENVTKMVKYRPRIVPPVNHRKALMAGP